MSLVELMVTLVITLVVSLAIFSVLNSSENRKRASVSINDIGQTGNYAVYALDKLIRSAGSGIAQGDGASFGCTLKAARNGTQVLPRTAALPAPFADVNTGTANLFKLAPLVIVPGGTTPEISGQSSDVLVIMGGHSGTSDVAAEFSSAATAAQVNVASTKGFSGGDQILVSDLSAAPTGDSCLIEEVTSGFSGGTVTALPVAANTGNSSYYYLASINGTSLASFTDTANDVVFNLGNVANGNPPVFAVLGVGDDNTLMGFDLLQNQNPTSSGSQVPYSIADGVFEMHARYGIDSDDDGKVDAWVTATGDFSPASLMAGTATAFKNIRRIKAVRVALIMRTAIAEKETVSNYAAGECDRSNTVISYFCTLTSATRTLDESEQHYRYRVVETTIPLRNAVMISTSDG